MQEHRFFQGHAVFKKVRMCLMPDRPFPIKLLDLVCCSTVCTIRSYMCSWGRGGLH